MADITTTFSITPQLLGFSGLDEAMRNNSQVPRQEVIYNVLDGDIPLTGVGDNQIISITTALPSGYAYVLAEVSMMLSAASGTTNGFADTFAGFVVDGVSGRNFQRFFEMTAPGLIIAGPQTALPARCYSPRNLPQVVILPPEGEVSLMALLIKNATAGDVAYKLNFFARFLMYDVNQAHHWAVNTPTLVR